MHNNFYARYGWDLCAIPHAREFIWKYFVYFCLLIAVFFYLTLCVVTDASGWSSIQCSTTTVCNPRFTLSFFALFLHICISVAIGICFLALSVCLSVTENWLVYSVNQSVVYSGKRQHTNYRKNIRYYENKSNTLF